MMQDHGPKMNFWIGNGFLVLALLLLLFMGKAWEELGVLAMVLWVGLIVAGMYFLMKDKDRPNMPG